jgi:hypothetical protein
MPLIQFSSQEKSLTSFMQIFRLNKYCRFDQRAVQDHTPVQMRAGGTTRHAAKLGGGTFCIATFLI